MISALSTIEQIEELDAEDCWEIDPLNLSSGYSRVKRAAGPVDGRVELRALAIEASEK